MQHTHHGYEITDDRSRLDFALIHRWLAGTYWSPGIARPKVEQAAKHSALVVGAYGDGASGKRQVGYCRVISDRTRFAWLADVIIDPDHRGQGLGQAIVAFALKHPDLAEVQHWMLRTMDAHGVYEKLGFQALDEAEAHLLMQLRRKQDL